MIILVDLDGVLADFELGLNSCSLSVDEAKIKEGFFLNLQLIQGGIMGLNRLIDLGHEIFICSTSPWDNPMALAEKRIWVENNLGEYFKKRIIFTHHKNLIKADYLIDDRKKNGASKFDGKLILFHKKNNNWDRIIHYFETMV